jgi:predicted transcriptional regulator
VPNQINRKKAEVEQSLNRSLNQLTERSQRRSSIVTRESLSGINDLSSMIATLIDQLMDQQGNGGGGGMSMQQMVEQMQQMSGDQQQLNQQLQEMVNDLQGNRLTQEQSERLDQLARQQNEIRSQLQELMKRGALNQGDRALSELQRMMEEMEESIMDMRGGITDPIMVERQQNILSRMLNAEDALQKRGEDEEREGTRAPDFDRTFPPEMTLQELQQEIRSRLQDPNYTRFSDQYQQLIERYFEQLRKLEENQLP